MISTDFVKRVVREHTVYTSRYRYDYDGTFIYRVPISAIGTTAFYDERVLWAVVSDGRYSFFDWRRL